MKTLFNKVLVLLFFLVSLNGSDQFRAYSEPFPPYNFLQNNLVVGLSPELLENIMKQSGYDFHAYDVTFSPWAKAYDTVLNTPNTILLSAARTEQRENLFQWVGPLATIQIGLIAKKSKNIKIASESDLQTYTIATIQDGAPEQLLIKKGIPQKNLVRFSFPEAQIRKLDNGTVDLFAFSVPTARYLIKKMGLKNDDFEVVYVLKTADLYYAFHQDTPKQMIEKLNKTLEGMKISTNNEVSHYDTLKNRCKRKYLE